MAAVHYQDWRHESGRIAFCGTFSPQGLTNEWRHVTCQRCARKRAAWRKRGYPSIGRWQPAPPKPEPIPPKRRWRPWRRRAGRGGSG